VPVTGSVRLAYQIDQTQFADFVDTSTAPELLADGFVWTEGPVWLNHRLYFNDIPDKQMHSWQPGAGVKLVLANNEFSNGNTVGLDGRMVSCEHGGRRVVVRENPADLSSATVLAEQYESMRLNSPNDVVVKSDGSIWFTDPTYGIDSNIEGYAAPSEIGSNNVYRVDTDGSISVVADDFDKPNGLAFSPDESLLYISDTGAARGEEFPGLDLSRPHHIRVFKVKDNRLTEGRIFAEFDIGVPDCFRVDTQGYLWSSAGDGIHCLSPDGQLQGKIVTPSAASNCCFGGDSGTDLFITASDQLYRVSTTRQCAATNLRSQTKG